MAPPVDEPGWSEEQGWPVRPRRYRREQPIASLGSCVAAFIAGHCERTGLDDRDLAVDVRFDRAAVAIEILDHDALTPMRKEQPALAETR